jgi:endonuclease/exonuclease/phosphatase family metal-dependent hydrolase
VKQPSRDLVEPQIDFLARHRPDIIVLQEAYRGDVDRYRAGLASRTALQWHAQYAPAIRRADGNEGSGVMALSAWPIVSSETLIMRHTDRWTTGRPALRIRVRHPDAGRDIDVVTTHLAAGEDGRSARSRQAPELRNWIGDPTGATLIGGDLNAEPGDAEISSLVAAFADVWVQRGRGTGETFSADRPTRRIDYWLVSRTGAVSPIETAVIDVCGASQCLSDHKALVAVFELRR